MFKIATTVALLSATALAAYADEKTTFCTQIGILSSKVMELRQQEIPLSTVMSSEVDPSLKELRDAIVLQAYEPRRVCRRPFGLSYAAMAGASSMA